MKRIWKVKIRTPDHTMYFVTFSDNEADAVNSVLKYTGNEDKNCFTTAWEIHPLDRIVYIATEEN